MRVNLLIVCVLGALTIGLGAFGAHGLKEVLTSEELINFKTGVRYQMYHVLVLLFVLTTQFLNKKSKKIISSIFYLAILFFSGSIYAITLGVESKNIWFITPFGGLLFIIGWIKLGFDLFKGLKI
ncbi:DUF423 domain-containing protein [Lutibacter sp. TH_r2]|uniref:DUF423 domain-containing protein n=1 Tax=Lutibacter sp. TH_r2 TaxID=3082083 RepID=UPI0029530755|nr:DUF423 domain-containing protein [Lutibacter sp. TH_r2]MDV7187711.1 DUF423 domain-containing protein [Lutibacter sp. TH_r2]